MQYKEFLSLLSDKLRRTEMLLVKPQRNIHFRIRFQIERMKMRLWWKHLKHHLTLPFLKN